jgi:hypothetical protein
MGSKTAARSSEINPRKNIVRASAPARINFGRGCVNPIAICVKGVEQSRLALTLDATCW